MIFGEKQLWLYHVTCAPIEIELAASVAAMEFYYLVGLCLSFSSIWDAQNLDLSLAS